MTTTTATSARINGWAYDGARRESDTSERRCCCSEYFVCRVKKLLTLLSLVIPHQHSSLFSSRYRISLELPVLHCVAVWLTILRRRRCEGNGSVQGAATITTGKAKRERTRNKRNCEELSRRVWVWSKLCVFRNVGVLKWFSQWVAAYIRTRAGGGQTGKQSVCQVRASECVSFRGIPVLLFLVLQRRQDNETNWNVIPINKFRSRTPPTQGSISAKSFVLQCLRGFAIPKSCAVCVCRETETQ